MKKLIIVGAGQFGREVFDWACDMPARSVPWRFAGFLDGNLKSLEGKKTPAEVMGTPESWEVSPDECFVVAIASPRTRLRIASLMSEKGATFVSVRHPTAIVGTGATIGEGSVICPYAVISNHVVLGQHVIVNCHSTIGHDAKLASFCTLSGHCDVTGFAELGTGVFMGSHASMLPRAVAGDWSVVGAGSVVLKGVPPNATVVGVPAKVVFQKRGD